MFDQQRLRRQSDQSLCKSLEYSMNIKLLLEFLSLKVCCIGSSESKLKKLSLKGHFGMMGAIYNINRRSRKTLLNMMQAENNTHCE